MNNEVSKLFVMLLYIVLSQIIYLKLDEKYEITKKVSSKLHIREERKSFFCICSSIIIVSIIGVVGIYVIGLSSNVYFILSGIIIGIGGGMASKMSTKKMEVRF